MARKIFIPKLEDVKPIENINFRTSGMMLYRVAVLWGNKTVAVTRAFESYLAFRDMAADTFSNLFTFSEVEILLKGKEMQNINFEKLMKPSTLIASIEQQVIDSAQKSSLKAKLSSLSDLELGYLLLELERIAHVKKFADENYNSFKKPIQ